MLDLGAGGGYEDNLNNAPSSSQREGSAFGTSWFIAGVSVPLTERTRLGVSGAYNGTYYAAFDDLTVHALTVRSSVRWSLRQSTSLGASAGAGRRWYGEDDRSATVYEASLALRERLTPRVSITPGYRYASQAAEASTFSSRSNRLALGGEFGATEDGWFGFGYAAEVGQSAFYQPASVPTPSSGRGRRPSTTFGTNQVVFKDDTTTHTVSAYWEQKAVSIVLHVEYAHAWISADTGAAHRNLVWASVGYRY